MVLSLTILNESQRGQNILLKENRVVSIGRGSNCDFQIHHSSISRKHCSIFYEEGRVWIEEGESTNGIRVNGEEIQKASLEVGDYIQLGTVQLKLESGIEEESSRPYDSSASTMQVPAPLQVEATNHLYEKEEGSPTFTMETLNERYVKLLYEIGKKAQNSDNVRQLFRSILEAVIRSLDAERGCILLKPGENVNKSHILFLISSLESFEEEEFFLERPIIDEILTKGRGVVSTIKIETTRKNKESLARHIEKRAVLCVPIKGQKGTLGAIYLDSPQETNLFGQGELDLLTAIGRQTGNEVKRLYLEQEEERYRSIALSMIKNSKDVLYRRQTDQSFVIISPSVEKLLGFSAQDYIDTTDLWERCTHTDDQERVFDKRASVFGGQECSIEYRMICKQEVVWVYEESYPVYDKNGQVVCIQGLVRNITEKKQLEEHLERAQKMKALGVLAGGVAHDLNNTLGCLIGYPDLLLMQIQAGSPLRKPIESMKKSAEKAANVVQDLLMMARRDPYPTEALDINEILQEYLESSDLENLKKNNTHVKIMPSLIEQNLIIEGSAQHLARVLLNLTINAIESVNKKAGVLEIATDWVYLDKTTLCYDKIKEGEYAVIRISDNGEGIPEEDQKRIFEPFYNWKKDSKSSRVGLGLAVVYGIVQDHKGYVDVKSMVNMGTSFIIYLPLNNQVRKKAEISAPHLQGSEHILVVDDVHNQRELTRDFLGALGYKVETVSSGEEALTFLKNSNFDLVILDMILQKGINGLDTYKTIRKILPQQKVIVTSGFAHDENIREALKLGAGAFVQKPFTIEKISLAVRNELDKQITQGHTILIADDEENLREMLIQILQGLGHTVIAAENGESALELFRDEGPDMVILDVNMGAGRNGFEICKIIREDPYGVSVPIIMLTGMDQNEAMVHGFQKGADDYIRKPFKIAEFRARVNAQLSKIQRQSDKIGQLSDRQFKIGTVVEGESEERYKITSRLSSGGMGVIFRGVRLNDDTKVAIKTLNSDFLDNYKDVKRFFREAKATIQIKHPHVSTGLEIIRNNEYCLYIMEYVAGESLATILSKERFLSQEKSVKIIRQLTDGVCHFNKLGLIHRDIKPGNILVDEEGNAVLIDMGLTKMTNERSDLTTDGIILGTPYYLSPEQAMGEPLDIRSDIYSLGVTFYHLLTGSPPFRGPTTLAIINARFTTTPEVVDAIVPHISSRVSEVVEKMMAHRLEDRHQTPEELLEELIEIEKLLQEHEDSINQKD